MADIRSRISDRRTYSVFAEIGERWGYDRSRSLVRPVWNWEMILPVRLEISSRIEWDSRIELV